MKFSGIYTITNVINNKIYVGCGINIHNRIKSHKSCLRNNRHGNIHLQRAWNEYGEESFLFEVLVECEKEFLYSEENYWCNLLNVHNFHYGYNIKPTNPFSGNGGMAEESRKKLSIKAKLRPPMSIETRKKLGDRSRGRKGTLKQRNATSQSNRERIWSEEARQKQRDNCKKRNAIDKCIKMHQKKVLQYDLDNNFIKEYESIADACRETNITRHQVYSQCYQQVKTFRKCKFIWKFKE